MDRQINSLTSLRGIAALVVVIHHFAYYLFPQTGVYLSTHTDFFHNGYLWVDFFFILSGFIMTHVYGKYFRSSVRLADYRSFLFARIARIYPLHLFTLLLFIGLELIKWLLAMPAFTGKFDVTALFTNFFLLQAFALKCPPLFACDTYWNEPAWSISVEFVIYCIFPAILVYLWQLDKKFNLFIYLCSSIGLGGLAYATRGNLDLIGVPSIFRCGLECIMGIITYKIYDRRNYPNYLNLNLVTLGATTWIIYAMHAASFHVRSFYDVTILLAFSVLMLAVSTQQPTWGAKLLNSRSLVYLGTISYSIYLVHWFVGSLLNTLWLDRFHTIFGGNLQTWEIWMALTIFIAVTILAASLTYKFIEVPMRDLLKHKVYAKA